MSKAIIPVVMQRKYNEPQSLLLGSNPVRMITADDDRNEVIDIWFEVDNDKPPVNRIYMVVKAYGTVPEGYEHVGSALSSSGDSCHIYREVKQKPVNGGMAIGGLSREMDYEFSIFKAPSKSPFATGTTSEEGTYELLSRHSNYGTMGKAQLIHQLRQYGIIQVDDQEINGRTYLRVFHKLRPTDGM